MKRAIKEWLIVLASLADDAAVVLIILLVLWLLKIPIALPIIIFIVLFFVALAFVMHKLIIPALPLATYEVAVSNITSSDANVSWKTNGNTSSQVFYDILAHDNVTDYSHHTHEDLSLVHMHGMDLIGLSPSTTYHFRVKSTAENITAISNDKTFATAGAEGGGLHR
jgi:hypothetical protein